jgi:hypothetical protein
LGLFGVPADIVKSGKRKPTREGGRIVKVTVFVRVQLPVNVTVRRTLHVPAVVGVPEITPLASGGDKPGGNGVALNEVGLPVTVIVYENATPT